MRMISPFQRLTVSLLLLAGCVSSISAQGVIFSENFDADASANFIEIVSYNTDADPDGTANVSSDYNADYSSITVSGGTYNIPEAPNSGTPGTATNGAFLQVNNDGTVEAPALITIYPNIPPITVPHSMEFDFWYAPSSPGTTEFIGTGIQHAGDKILSVFQTDPSNFFSVPVSVNDGYFFHYTGEGGSATDISFLRGDPDSGTTETAILADGSEGFTWGGQLDALGNNNGTLDMPATSRGNFAANDIEAWHINTGLFGTLSSGEADGVNESWATMRIRYTASGIVTVAQNLYDGNGFVTICTYNDPDDLYTSGVPSITLYDAFGSTNTEGGLFIDNIVVTDESVTASDNWLTYE
jgi:hypothetical protein